MLQTMWSGMYLTYLYSPGAVCTYGDVSEVSWALPGSDGASLTNLETGNGLREEDGEETKVGVSLDSLSTNSVVLLLGVGQVAHLGGSLRKSVVVADRQIRGKLT